MSFAPAIIAGVGLAAQVGGQIAGGVSSRASAEKQKQYTADAAQEAGAMDIHATEWEIEKTKEMKKEMIGSQIATYGRGGVLLEGSPLTNIMHTAQKAEEDILYQRQNLKKRLSLRQKQAKAGIAEASQFQQASRMSDWFNIPGSALTGIANMPGAWSGSSSRTPYYKYSSPGYGPN